jgi:hypothetical protein
LLAGVPVKQAVDVDNGIEDYTDGWKLSLIGPSPARRSMQVRTRKCVPAACAVQNSS